jgi:hypothetical protein
MANGSQLKTLLASDATESKFYWPIFVLLLLSIAIQVIAGFLILALGSMDIEENVERANRINNAIVGLIFIVTVINVFIAAFGLALKDVTPLPHVPTAAPSIPTVT